MPGFSPTPSPLIHPVPRPWQQLTDRRQSHLLRPWRARTDDLPVILQAYFSGLAKRPYAWNGQAMYIRAGDAGD